MALPNGVYNAAKYTAQVGLPALGTLVMTLGAIWGIPYTDQIVKSIIAVNVALGALLVLNQVSYNKSDDKYDAILNTESNLDRAVLRDLNINPDDQRKQALLKIV